MGFSIGKIIVVLVFSMIYLDFDKFLEIIWLDMTNCD